MFIGDEIRNRNQFSGSYNASMEQVKKLGLGEHKYWVFLYEVNQLVLLNLEKFAVFIIANVNFYYKYFKKLEF